MQELCYTDTGSLVWGLRYGAVPQAEEPAAVRIWLRRNAIHYGFIFVFKQNFELRTNIYNSFFTYNREWPENFNFALAKLMEVQGRELLRWIREMQSARHLTRRRLMEFQSAQRRKENLLLSARIPAGVCRKRSQGNQQLCWTSERVRVLAELALEGGKSCFCLPEFQQVSAEEKPTTLLGF